MVHAKQFLYCPYMTLATFLKKKTSSTGFNDLKEATLSK